MSCWARKSNVWGCEVIETEQTVIIGAPIEAVWDYVQDVAKWADLMPGLQDCAVIDTHNSRWSLKVGVGALVRAVKVNVCVDAWDGPERVKFSFRLEGDPVRGGGTYMARAKSGQETDVTLTLQVSGSGPMAPMWEAMGKPLLPQFAKAFAGQLKERIEGAVANGVMAAAPRGWRGFYGWLKRVCETLLGSTSKV